VVPRGGPHGVLGPAHLHQIIPPVRSLVGRPHPYRLMGLCSHPGVHHDVERRPRLRQAHGPRRPRQLHHSTPRGISLHHVFGAGRHLEQDFVRFHPAAAVQDAPLDEAGLVADHRVDERAHVPYHHPQVCAVQSRGEELGQLTSRNVLAAACLYRIRHDIWMYASYLLASVILFHDAIWLRTDRDKPSI